MLRFSLFISLLLSSLAVFSVNASTQNILEHISVSAISGTPSMLEDSIMKIANEKNATAWEITSMRIDSNSYATAILYK